MLFASFETIPDLHINPYYVDIIETGITRSNDLNPKKETFSLDIS